MPVTVRPFLPADYLAAAPALYPWLDRPGYPTADRIAQGYLEGPAFSGLLDGELIGSAGVIIPWPGFGVTWAIITDLGRRHPVMIHRTVSRHLRMIIETQRLERVEATVLAGAPSHLRWVEALGFACEATMPAWGPQGETAYRYVLFPVHYEQNDGIELARRAGKDFVRVEGQWRPAMAGGTGVETTVLLGYASLAASAIGTGVAAYGSYAQGQQAEQAQRFNARVAENQAIAARNAAQVAAENKATEYRRIQATQRSRIGAAGITTEGSPLLAMVESAEQAALDVARIRYGGELTASAYDTEAQLRRYSARQAGLGGTLSAGTSLLTGLGTAAFRASRMGRGSAPLTADEIGWNP
jgi:hypothetical protein